jgi:uncharacterized membrane protein YphA (DoxX/SURF4 family)
MLNVFPDFLSYGLFGPTLLRIVVGLVFINLGYLHLTKERSRWEKFFEVIKLRPSSVFGSIYALIELVGGALLLIGLYTQVAAIILGALSLIEILVEYREPAILKRNIVFYVLVFAICASLIVTGAGKLAFDLPL